MARALSLGSIRHISRQPAIPPHPPLFKLCRPSKRPPDPNSAGPLSGHLAAPPPPFVGGWASSHETTKGYEWVRVLSTAPPHSSRPGGMNGLPLKQCPAVSMPKLQGLRSRGSILIKRVRTQVRTQTRSHTHIYTHTGRGATLARQMQKNAGSNLAGGRGREGPRPSTHKSPVRASPCQPLAQRQKNSLS